jgi:hypothetical protein
MPLLRSALWLHHASAVWDISHTAYYLAIINAVESLTQDINQGDPCPECGLRRGGGPTAAFEEFLDTFAPKTNEAEPSRKALYRARSRITHGGAILLSDIPSGWATLFRAEWEERDRSGHALELVQTAILNWWQSAM